ncbi:MAG: FtsL-like putative cell division protein [Bacteroidia bacterium]|jgi:hypothetical protein
MENEDLKEENPDPITSVNPGPEEEVPGSNPWLWVRFGFVAFAVMLFYIWNQHHANKALRKKEILTRELKELHSEKISLESEVTNLSKQSEIAEKLKNTGLKELTNPPIKIEYKEEDSK